MSRQDSDHTPHELDCPLISFDVPNFAGFYRVGIELLKVSISLRTSISWSSPVQRKSCNRNEKQDTQAEHVGLVAIVGGICSDYLWCHIIHTSAALA